MKKKRTAKRDAFSGALTKRIRQLKKLSQTDINNHPITCMVAGEKAEELKIQLDNYRRFKGWK